MTKDERETVERAIAWLTTSTDDQESIETRCAIARRELLEMVDDR